METNTTKEPHILDPLECIAKEDSTSWQKARSLVNYLCSSKGVITSTQLHIIYDAIQKIECMEDMHFCFQPPESVGGEETLPVQPKDKPKLDLSGSIGTLWTQVLLHKREGNGDLAGAFDAIIQALKDIQDHANGKH